MPDASGKTRNLPLMRPARIASGAGIAQAGLRAIRRLSPQDHIASRNAFGTSTIAPDAAHPSTNTGTAR